MIKFGWNGNVSHYSQKKLGHGREEIRNYLMLCDISHRIDLDNKWKQLNSIGMVESVRTENDKTTVETRYYISSLNLDAKKFGDSIRSHWGIENRCGKAKIGYEWEETWCNYCQYEIQWRLDCRSMAVVNRYKISRSSKSHL
jgi:predicted transposase YbfD/YdcC